MLVVGSFSISSLSDDATREGLMKKTLWRVKSIKDCFLVKTDDFVVPGYNFTDSDDFVSMSSQVLKVDLVSLPTD